MGISLKIELRNTLVVAVLTGLIGVMLPDAQARSYGIRLPEARDDKGQIRRDLLLIRYRPTAKSVLVDVYGHLVLSPRVLANLGISDTSDLKALDFEFYRIYATSRRRSSSGGWEGGFESWTANPSTKDLWLARESMSVLRNVEEKGVLSFVLEPTALALGAIHVPSKAVSTQDPEKARAERRKLAVSVLNTSWQQVLDKKYDLALVGFDKILGSLKADLNAEELNKAQFGRALSRFHQMGCREAGASFEELQNPGPYYEDSRYYGALCALDRDDLPVARERFQGLLAQNSERYEDAARFYLGVVAEKQGDFAAAESAYLDTIDFASDASIVALAKERVALLEEKKALDRYAKKLVSVMAMAGLGWDSNALSLPSSVRPADLNLETGASPNYLALAYLDLNNPLFYPLQQKFHYSFLMLGYTNTEISETSDLQSHSMGANVEWGEELGYRHIVDFKYGMTYLGKIGSGTKYLTSYGARWDLSKVSLNDKQQLDHIWMHGLEVSRQDPVAEATSAESDSTAWLIAGSHRMRKLWDERGMGVQSGQRR